MNKSMVEQIPMSSPDLTDAEIAAVNRVLATPHLSSGPQLEGFERAIAAYVGAAHAIGVNSGTSGLHLAIIAAGIGEGDRVITTPFSFVASANCILYERAVPVFVDLDPVTGNLDPALVAEAVEGRGGVSPPKGLAKAAPDCDPARASSKDQALYRAKAILPVHAFGQPADMDPIREVARQYELAIIEDACEALGAEYRGRKAGTLGDAAVFAFYPNKQMTTGEGGMIVTDDEEWANLCRSLRNQGRDVFRAGKPRPYLQAEKPRPYLRAEKPRPYLQAGEPRPYHDAWLHHIRLGYNYRLDEMSAALGLAQMGRIEELLAKRDRVAGWYNERLADLELVERPTIVPTTSRMSWFVYVVRIKPPASRDEVIRLLAEAGIPSRSYFTPIHLQPFYRQRFGYRRGDFPVTETLSDMSIALPFSGVMSEDQVDRVCEQLRVAVGATRMGGEPRDGIGAPRP